MARYRTYTEQDLIPALGAIPLVNLTRQHLAAFVTTQLRRGRGQVTVYRITATLSSALSTAVHNGRLARNPAKPPLLPRPPPPPDTCGPRNRPPAFYASPTSPTPSTQTSPNS
ncbi:hypothetical protein [Kitasatospora sp. SUK 42]|uniref:hypothetical protein n=1 Tax=Kitasatospora sp. SUK 42 TaxID=1588882 RepID=UPI0020C90CFA|nr:hypothetical protein [Kitasatospora sp. SUK 42]